MLNLWPSATLLFLFVLIWFEFRVIGGRTTLGLSRFAPLFLLGSIGSTVCSLFLQRLCLIFIDTKTQSWLTGPAIEEICKAAPVFVLIFLLLDWRRLSICDITLMGLASGLGFGFVEMNLDVLKAGHLPTFDHIYFSQFEVAAPASGYPIYWPGHGTTAALVCLFVALALRLGPGKVLAGWCIGIAALCLVIFDHAMYNWKVVHDQIEFTGAIVSFDSAAPWAEQFYSWILRGRLELILLPAFLILGSWIEGRRCRGLVGPRPQLLLPNEARPSVPQEWLIALGRLRFGARPLLNTLGFFRRRRGLEIASAEAARSQQDLSLKTYIHEMEDRLARERTALINPQPSGWFPTRSRLSKAAWSWLKASRWSLLARLAVIVSFMLGRAFLSGKAIDLLFSKTLGVVMSLVGLTFVIWRIRRFRRQSPPDPLRSNSEAQVNYHSQALLQTVSLGTSILGTTGLFLSPGMLIPPVRDISDHARDWIDIIGCPVFPMEAAGALGAARPEPKAADQLAKSLDDVKKEFEELQNQLRGRVADQLAKISQFNEDYSNHWAAAMKNLDGYRALYPGLMQDLKDLWAAHSDREWAKPLAEWSDQALQYSLMAMDAAHAGMKLVGGLGADAVVDAARAADGGALRDEAALAGREGADTARTAEDVVLRDQAGLAGSEGTGEGTFNPQDSADHTFDPSEGAGEGTFNPEDPAKGAFNPEDPAAHTFDPDAPPPGAAPTGKPVETSSVTQKRVTQAQSPAETLRGSKLDVAEALAEKQLQDLIEPIRASAGKNQCTQVSEAFAKSWETGIEHVVRPTAIVTDEGRQIGDMQKLFNNTYKQLGDDPTHAMSQITQILQRQGPGSQALISVERLTEVGQDVEGVTELDGIGHSFNAVNIDGFVKFVDVRNILRPGDLDSAFNWHLMTPKF